jgi:hypothetical protein
MWQSGIRHVFDSNGLIRNSTNCFDIIPDNTFDNTLRFKVDSFWTLDDGKTYKCTDATTGAAVWELWSVGSIPTLQDVLDNNHDLVDGLNFQGSSAGDNNTGIFVNALGQDAANTNTGTQVNALGTEAANQNEGDNVNALGNVAAGFNTGNNVNALGDNAGNNNTFNNVNLFGNAATADEDGQTVFSKNGSIFARISTTDLTATRKYTLQDGDGTLAFLSDITGGGGVTSVGLTMPSAFSVTNSPITSSGDIAVTGAGLVSQYIRGDGTLANFPNSTGGGSSVNYYLNGSVSQGTFGGDTYYQMSKTPILGAGTNFTRTNGAGNGYIASFITDAGDPSFLNIPGGNWNVEFYFQSSATGGSPQFYGEIYKVSATNVFTLVASGSANPEGITNGTTVDQYFTSIPVPQTSLLITDRLAIRIYVITSGRTITLHTENGNLCEVLTTFTTGLTALNGLTQQVQNLAVGTSGTDFAISSVTDTHTFNLPTASATNRGALSSADWSIFNGKQNVVSGVSDTEIGYLDGVTSAIQTQLNTKCQSIYNLTSQITHTGTTAKTIILSFLIPANTFTDGDFLNFSAIVAKTSVTTTTHNLEINTTNTLTGATIIATAGFSSTNATMKFKREIVLNGGSAFVLNVSTGTPNDSIVGVNVTPLSQYTYNLAADLYFFITCTLTNTTDSITYRGVSVTKN